MGADGMLLMLLMQVISSLYVLLLHSSVCYWMIYVYSMALYRVVIG